MDPALYTLIGALGGVFLTQVANYSLERKRSKHQEKLKKLEIDSKKSHDLLIERRNAYSKYLSDLDFYIGKRRPDLAELMPSFYTAMILASKPTSEAILNAFKVASKQERDNGALKEAKGIALEAMKSDLQH